MSQLLNAHTQDSIIVGVDGSAPSRAAITWAMRYGARAGADVVLVHVVVDDISVPEAFIDPDSRRAALAFLQGELDYAHLIDRHVTVSTKLLQGDPLEQLSAVSEHAAVVAIGTHKTGFVQGRVFGSRYIQLAGLAFCPVAFIPNSASHRRSGVVVGVGNVEQDEDTIRFAAREAERSEQELVIIHCSRTTASGFERTGSAGWDPVLIAAESIARRDHPTLSIRCRTIDRAPAEGLVDGSMSATLLVIGRSHRSIQHPGSVGSIVHDVLLNLAGPTVVVHDTVAARRSTFAHHRRTDQLT